MAALSQPVVHLSIDPAQPAAGSGGRAARSRRGPDRAAGRRRLPAGDGREGEDRRARAVRARRPDRRAAARCGAARGREAEPRALRAARGRGAARPGRARAQARQRRGRPAAPGDRARDRAGLHRGLVAGRGRRSQHARAAAPACCRAACAGWSATGRSSTGRTWSRSSATCPARGCASPTASSPTCIPAEIADLVEAASHEEGEEIIEAVGQDRELEADVFEELDEHHQLEFIRERPDAQVAAVIARMAADDAADLIVEIDQERRARVLALLPPAQRRQIEALLGYNPSTAGGLMSPDFILLARGRSARAGDRAGAHERPRARHADHRLPARRRGPAVGLGCGRHAAARRRRVAAARGRRARAGVGAARTPTCPRSRAR